MRISRVYMEQGLEAGGTVELSGEAAHYLGTVLRHKAGDSVNLFNGEDGEFRARIVEGGRKRLTVELLEALPGGADARLGIHLALGLSRGERMDYAVQKATELGATSVTPLFTEHCEVKLDARRADKRRRHWRKVAINACEQCGRCRPPHIDEPLALSRWLEQAGSGNRFVLDHREENGFPGTLPRAGDVTLLIGPEGGLSPGELDAARTAGFLPVRMGPRVLRSETAPVAALAIIQQLYGDFA